MLEADVTGLGDGGKDGVAIAVSGEAADLTEELLVTAF